MTHGRCLAAALVVAALAVAIGGCGGGEERDSASAQAAALKRAATARKLNLLRHQLRARKAAIRAQREQAARKARKTKHRAAQQAAGTATANSSSFAALESELGGEIGSAIGPPGAAEPQSYGNLTSGSAWSTSKVPIALRLLQDVGGPSGLSSTQAEEMRSALTLSDNEAAAALFADLERSHGGVGGASAAVGEVLREAGDGTTEISTQGRDGFSSYGQTEWSLANQWQFVSQLAAGCISTAASRQYVLDLMGEVSSDSWGLGSAGLPARWKGGWGPGLDGRYLVRQMGVLYVGDREVAVTLAAIPSDGQFETGESMATGIAQWLAQQAQAVAAAPAGC